MKTREEIEKHNKAGMFPGITGIAYFITLSIEVLLDIRELLQDIKERKMLE